MGLRNGISIGIRKKHIRIGNKFDCVEGVRPLSFNDSWKSENRVSKSKIEFPALASI